MSGPETSGTRYASATSDHDADLDAIVAMLSDAGMVEAFTDDDGKPALRLTSMAARVAR